MLSAELDATVGKDVKQLFAVETKTPDSNPVKIDVLLIDATLCPYYKFSTTGNTHPRF